MSGARKQVVRSNAPVTCAHCKRRVERHARQQMYCSPLCRKRAHEQGRNRVRKAGLGGSTGAPDAPPKNFRENNNLQGPNTGSSIPYNLFGGGQRQLPGAVPPDAELRRKILRAEVGGALL